MTVAATTAPPVPSTGMAISIPRPSPWPVFEHRLVQYRRVWRGTVFSSFLMPLLIMVGMGISVGSYVDRAGQLGVPYLDYIAPGILASTAVQVALSESTYSIMSAFAWTKIYHAMRASPLRPVDLVGGELLFISVRVVTSAVGFLVVMAPFGLLRSAWAVAVLPIALLAGLSLAAPIVAYSATVRTESMLAVLFRLVLIPMTLFAGVFFPVTAMPLVARWVAYATPLWHGVELSRAATSGAATALPPLVHIGYLVLWLLVGYMLACWRYQRRLTD